MYSIEIVLYLLIGLAKPVWDRVEGDTHNSHYGFPQLLVQKSSALNLLSVSVISYILSLILFYLKMAFIYKKITNGG